MKNAEKCCCFGSSPFIPTPNVLSLTLLLDKILTHHMPALRGTSNTRQKKTPWMCWKCLQIKQTHSKAFCLGKKNLILSGSVFFWKGLGGGGGVNALTSSCLGLSICQLGSDRDPVLKLPVASQTSRGYKKGRKQLVSSHWCPREPQRGSVLPDKSVR